MKIKSSSFSKIDYENLKKNNENEKKDFSILHSRFQTPVLKFHLKLSISTIRWKRLSKSKWKPEKEK